MLIIQTLAIAVLAFTYTHLLTDDEMIFSRPYHLAERQLPAWLFKPLIGCEKCVAGQLALWFFLVANWGAYDLMTAAIHIWYISQAIFNVTVITKLWYRILDPGRVSNKKQVKVPPEVQKLLKQKNSNEAKNN